MDKEKAKRMFEAARVKVDVNARTFLDFDKLSATDFLEKYCWVVFASGFRNKIVKANFPAITVVFKNFDLDALADLKPIKRDTLPIQNKLKADNFLKGCKMIAREGFDGFKSRVSEGGMDVLQELPWIGDVTKYHLAMNIGLQDTAKPDVWLKRCAESCSTTGCLLSILLTNTIWKNEWLILCYGIIVRTFNAYRILTLNIACN